MFTLFANDSQSLCLIQLALNNFPWADDVLCRSLSQSTPHWLIKQIIIGSCLIFAFKISNAPDTKAINIYALMCCLFRQSSSNFRTDKYWTILTGLWRLKICLKNGVNVVPWLSSFTTICKPIKKVAHRSDAQPGVNKQTTMMFVTKISEHD